MKAQRYLPLLIGPLLGAYLGMAQTGGLIAPSPVDPKIWNSVTAGLDANMAKADAGRGIYQHNGALWLIPLPFHRPTTIFPADLRPPGKVVLQLADNSGPLQLLFSDTRPGQAGIMLSVSPTGIRTQRGFIAGSSEHTFLIKDGNLSWFSGTAQENLGSLSPSRVELKPEEIPAKIQSIHIEDSQNNVLIDQVWAPDHNLLLPGLLLGLVLGLACVFSPASALWLLLPLACLIPDLSGWLRLVTRLYLVRLDAPSLARLCFGASFVPFLGSLFASIPWLQPTRSRQIRWLFPIGGMLLAAGAATVRSGPSPAMIVGLPLLFLPSILAFRVRLEGRRLLLQDLPGLVALGALGWEAGLLPLLCWRVVCALAAIPLLVEKSPRAGVDHLLLLFLCSPFALEFAARSTFLDTAWDPSHLNGETDTSWKNPVAFWQSFCGEGQEQTLIFSGGSSTGGAYQFRTQPELFFPAQAHIALCEQRPPGTRLITKNFGLSGGDSFVISRGIETILGDAQTPLLVLYLGVNDLYTHSSALTRAQREAQEGSTNSQLTNFSARSRLITGLGLLMRPDVQISESNQVAEVPLPDAEENLRRIAAAVSKRGGTTIFMTEFVQETTRNGILPYEQMERKLAQELPNTRFIDAHALLTPFTTEVLLLDHNHLSADGNRHLGQSLTPDLRTELNWGPHE